MTSGNESILALKESAENTTHVGSRPKRILPEQQLFNPEDSRIKEDIIRMIIQYLQNEGYVQSNMVLQDEANVKFADHRALENQVRGFVRFAECINVC